MKKLSGMIMAAILLTGCGIDLTEEPEIVSDSACYFGDGRCRSTHPPEPTVCDFPFPNKPSSQHRELKVYGTWAALEMDIKEHEELPTATTTMVDHSAMRLRSPAPESRGASITKTIEGFDLTLSDSRLIVSKKDEDGLYQHDSIDVAHSSLETGSHYNQLLMNQGIIYVLGYRDHRAGLPKIISEDAPDHQGYLEINTFQFSEGKLNRLNTRLIQTGNYLRGSSSSVSIVEDQLIILSQQALHSELEHSGVTMDTYKILEDDSIQNGPTLFSPEDIYGYIQMPEEQDLILHQVTSCDSELNCSAKALIEQSQVVAHTSENNVFLATDKEVYKLSLTEQDFTVHSIKERILFGNDMAEKDEFLEVLARDPKQRTTPLVEDDDSSTNISLHLYRLSAFDKFGLQGEVSEAIDMRGDYIQCEEPALECNQYAAYD